MPKGVYIRSGESKKAMSKAHTGKHFSEEHKMKLSKIKKELGLKTPSRKGMPHTEKTRLKMSKSRKGDKCYWWRGGVSFEPYTTDWTKTLKRSIRERDNYTCQCCGKLQSDIAFDIHHIDYNKKNCNPDNLITLCRSCHTKDSNNYYKKRKESGWKAF